MSKSGGMVWVKLPISIFCMAGMANLENAKGWLLSLMRSLSENDPTLNEFGAYLLGERENYLAHERDRKKQAPYETSTDSSDSSDSSDSKNSADSALHNMSCTVLYSSDNITLESKNTENTKKPTTDVTAREGPNSGHTTHSLSPDSSRTGVERSHFPGNDPQGDDIPLEPTSIPPTVNLPAKRRKTATVEVYDCGVLEIWEAMPQISKERSSRRELAKAWEDAGKPFPGTVVAALEVWKQSEKWTKDSGTYQEAAHRWMKNRKWEELPAIPKTPAQEREEAFEAGKKIVERIKEERRLGLRRD